MGTKNLCFLISLLVYSLYGVAIFQPPTGWQAALPKTLSSYVQVGFVGKGSTYFHPSINLAIEEINVSQKEYIEAVRKIHVAKPETTWRNLGKFPMKGGVGTLTEISHPSSQGRVKLLQAILVKDHYAYILTAAMLYKDFPDLQKEILQSLQSLALYPHWIDAISEENRQAQFKEKFAELGHFTAGIDVAMHQTLQWENFQKEVVEDYPEMGSHWHFYALQEGYGKIFTEEKK